MSNYSPTGCGSPGIVTGLTLFNTPAKGLENIKKSQAIKHTADQKTAIPADDSEEQPGLGCEQADG